jgi:tetratricopeptide (TPR) repeat protein
MATLTAPTEALDRAEAGSPAYSVGQLWQVPVFFIGLVALATVALLLPFFRPDPARQLQHELADARHLLQHGGDPEGARRHAQHALEAAEKQFPDRVAEAEFLLGAAHVRLAEAGPDELALEHWRLARQHLEEAQRLGVPVEDRPGLAYVLGKVGFHTQDDPQRVVANLKAGVEQAADPAEAYTLLTQAYLNLNPPDVKEAWQANKKLRQVPRLGEDVLAPAKLLGARLLVQLNRAEEARKTLEKIGEQSPPAVQAEARLLLARLNQEAGKWAAAAELWKAVLAAPPSEEVPYGRVLYDLGQCCSHLDRADQAIAVWEDCLKRGQGPEAPASALALAELWLQGGKLEKSVPALGQALSVARVSRPDDWNNALVPLPKVRDLFERAAQVYRKAGRPDLTVQLAELYEHVAAPPRARTLQAEAWVEWAHSRRKQAEQAGKPEEQKKSEEEAHTDFNRAAALYAEVAEQLTEATERDEALWLSAVCSAEGQEYAKAAKKFERFVRQTTGHDRLGEGWYRLGEMRRLSKDPTAEEAYRESLKFHTHFAYRSRYQLAMLAIERGQLDEAEAALERNLKLLYWDPDLEAQEESLFALGGLLYRRGNYRKVVQRLEEAVGRFPSNPEVTRARFQLADSYRLLATQEEMTRTARERMSQETRRHFEDEHQRWLEKAATAFLELADFLEKPEARGHLSPELEAEVPFIAARCLFNLGRYEMALTTYQRLAEQCRGKPESLAALGGMVSCYSVMGDAEKMLQYLGEIRRAAPGIAAMKPEDRAAWVDWAERCSRLATPADNSRRPAPINNGGPAPDGGQRGPILGPS